MNTKANPFLVAPIHSSSMVVVRASTLPEFATFPLLKINLSLASPSSGNNNINVFTFFGTKLGQMGMFDLFVYHERMISFYIFIKRIGFSLVEMDFSSTHWLDLLWLCLFVGLKCAMLH